MSHSNNDNIFQSLRCPHCFGKLGKNAEGSELSCPSHGKFPVINGVPSFSGGQSRFDRHWNREADNNIPSAKQKEALNFLTPLFDLIEKKKKGAILDAGCGDGVHTSVIADSNFLPKGWSFSGVDISLSALFKARKQARYGWEFIHSDMALLPFEDCRFDVVYAFGSIAYTNEPFASFNELCRVTKKGGLIGLWMYPQTNGVMGVVFSAVRKICAATSPFGPRLIADMIVPVLGLLPTKSKVSLGNATWKQCREVVLVNIAPENFIFPKPEEIASWFKKNNVKITVNAKEAPITLWGVKQ